MLSGVTAVKLMVAALLRGLPVGRNPSLRSCVYTWIEVERISLGCSPLPNFVRTMEDLLEVQKPHHIGDTQTMVEVAITMSRDCWW